MPEKGAPTLLMPGIVTLNLLNALAEAPLVRGREMEQVIKVAVDKTQLEPSPSVPPVN